MRTTGIILISGLALGLTVVYFIGQFIVFEKSYDTFHSKSDRIFRLPLSFYKNGSLESKDAANVAPLGPKLKEEFPEIESFLRLSPEYSRVIFKHGDRKQEAEKVFYADSSFLQIFDFPLLEGDPQSSLQKPFTVLLTKALAERLFGTMDTWTESPLGKSLKMNDEYAFEISGILDDLPNNSHLHFSALFSFSSFYTTNENPNSAWGWNDFYTYILLKEDSDVADFEKKLAVFNKKYDPNKQEAFAQTSSLQALKDIHLSKDITFELEPGGDPQTINFLFLIALSILLIAWVNYINIATARAEERANEVGIRKLIGANRGSLINQFLTEALLINLLAFCLSLVLIQTGQQLMDLLVGHALPNYLSTLQIAIIIPCLLLIGTLGSGFYPALILAGLAQSRVLSSNSNWRNKEWIRKSLVVFQYGISLVLIAGTIVVFLQLRHMKQQDLGFALDEKLILKAPSTINDSEVYAQKYKLLKDRLYQSPEIKVLGGSGAIPGKNYLDLDSHGGVRLASAGEDKNATFSATYADQGFLDAYAFDFLAGRNFSDELQSDAKAIILTKSALQPFGFQNAEAAISQKVYYEGVDKVIIGVIEDYHHKSLRHQFEPMIFRYWKRDFLYLSLQLESESRAGVAQLISRIKDNWEQIYPNDPFDYFFLDEHFNEQYLAEQQLSRIFTVFAVLAIFISCLGLLGLASYIISTRTKEIGIRKVLGASIPNIVSLLSKDFLKLVIIAFILTLPISVYLLNNWLDNFTSRINLYWWLFLIVAIIALLLAFLTISIQSIKAALANPVEALKN